VIGAGSWGTTLADLLARQDHQVTLWAYEQEVAAAITATHENPLFLPGCPLSPGLRATNDLAMALDGAGAVVVASPSHVTAGLLRQVAPLISAGTLVIGATKGIETESLELMSEVACRLLPPHRFVALSGPSFAAEVYQGQPTAVVAASPDAEAALAVQSLATTAYFRIYSSGDLIGTELAGSLKNVIAIAAGMLEGLGLGHNPRAALITRGLAEIGRLGAAMGADPRTFAGLAGMGDLILTTCGALSRNRSLGVALAQGQSLESYRLHHRTVAEGVNTARAAVRLGARFGVELPIATQVSAILFDRQDPQRAIGELMERSPKSEHGE